MTFDYISDLHLEFIFGTKEPREKTVKAWFNDVFQNKKSDTLIIPGDICESISHTFTFFELVQEIYGYKNIVYVFGNHDFWITNGSQKKKYKSSYNKIEVSKLYASSYNNKHESKIYLLDGNLIEIDGVLIGGAMGWYSTEYFYANRQMYTTLNPYLLWQSRMNDQKYIVPRKGNYEELTKIEYQKVLNVIKQKPDIMVTHICPTISNRVVEERYKGDLTNTFYMFNAEELIQEYQPKYWLYGHMHGQKELEIYNTVVLRNAHGYPSENLIQEVKTILINI
jgi:predicted phosphohydrolase